MEKKFSEVKLVPDSYAHLNLSQGIIFEQLLFISGQASVDERGVVVYPNDFEHQAEQAFANLNRVLSAGGSSMAEVLKVTIFVTEMRYFETIVAMRKKYFSAPYPADSIVEVKGLFDPAAMIEIEALALRSSELPRA